MLSNASLKEINALSGLSRDTTPLDMAYRDPEQNPIGFDIIKPIRKYGGSDHHNEKTNGVRDGICMTDLRLGRSKTFLFGVWAKLFWCVGKIVFSINVCVSGSKHHILQW